ncbi:YkgJ family cysteine cluster protein [Paraburkholderia silvatlantica]|uniref:YkgJ family cysteine cluster protein n=1 Tax=Paraburkholderia silvatlantica TaxID=321895 RepID=UPI003753DD2C
MTAADMQAAIDARWVELESGRLARVISIINEQALPVKIRHKRDLNTMLNDQSKNVDAMIEALWKAVDEVGAVAAPRAACRKGCSHCCHTSVLLPAQEAALIGKRIGVKPEPHKGITQRGDIEAGYHNPCPFLREGECSIYESRPLACRQQYNMDIDALLCDLSGGPSKVPYLNMLDYQQALVLVTAGWRRLGLTSVPAMPDVGDIRQFFPNGKEKKQ